MSWGPSVVRFLRGYAGWLAWSAAFLVLVGWALAELCRIYDVEATTIAAFGPPATTVAAGVALVVGVATVRQKAATDARDQWWKRVQWALERALEADVDSQALGLATLQTLLAEKATNRSDVAMLDSAYNSLNPLGRFAALGAE